MEHAYHSSASQFRHGLSLLLNSHLRDIITHPPVSPTCSYDSDGYSCTSESPTITNKNAAQMGQEVRALLLLRRDILPLGLRLRHHQLGRLG
jgi:hypothetical protein